MNEMLLFALALGTAAVTAAPPPQVRPAPARVRRVRARGAAPAPRLTLAVAEWRATELATADSRSRYRLANASYEIVDAKQRVLKEDWRKCGLTGAPVCPSKGRRVFYVEQ